MALGYFVRYKNKFLIGGEVLYFVKMVKDESLGCVPVMFLNGLIGHPGKCTLVALMKNVLGLSGCGCCYYM